MTHGTHVAGIVGASKDGVGMHGAAYDANLVGVPAGYDLTEKGSRDFSDTFVPFYAREDVKVINNSWSDPVYFDEVVSEGVDEILNNTANLDDFPGKFVAYISEFNAKYSPQVATLGDAAEHGKLLIFAAGNTGHPTPAKQSGQDPFHSCPVRGD